MRRLAIREGITRLWLPLGTLLVCGCAQFQTSRIDPTGEQIFVSGPAAVNSPSAVNSDFRAMPGPRPSSGASAVVLCPRDTVAPVGSEVVLLAAVRGFDQYLRTNERVEWMLAPRGVGQFVQLDKGSWTNLFVGDFTRAQKIDNSYAVNSTSRRLLRLTRGTPGLEDDVHVLRGQAWITVTSPREGISTVTAFAPNVYGWPCRKQSATIHWIDAQWSFPSPAISTAGTRRTLTTTVARHTDQSPRAGWLVRYNVVDGPPAGFAPDGSPTVEVQTDPAGQASVEIFQTQPAAGTNQIAIQVIRPEGPCAVDGQPQKRLPVGTGCVLQTWSAGDLAVRMTGPASATVGAVVAYRIEVSNPGDLPIDDVVVTEQEPAGMTYARGTPQPERTGGTLRWRLGSVAAGETQTLQVEFHAEREGTVEFCAEAVAANGLAARQCVTTSVMKPTVAEAPKIEVRISGPDRKTVGDNATFALVISNRSQVPATGLIIKDTFDAGLKHSEPGQTIKRELGQLGPWESKEIGIEFRVAEPGRLCHTVQISDASGVLATASACLEATEPPRAEPPPYPRPEPAEAYPGRPGAEPSVSPEGDRRVAPHPAYPPYPPRPETPVPSVPDMRPGTAQPPAPYERDRPTQPLAPHPSPISVNITATPEASRVGEETQFAIELTNTGDVPLNDVVVACKLDENFDLENALATEGHRRTEDDVLELNVRTVRPGQLALPFDIQSRCLQESDRACVRVSVTCREGIQTEDELCVRILAAGAPLSDGVSLTIDDLSDPIAQGKELTYLIRVKNHGVIEDHNVTLQVTLPSEIVIDRLKTFGPPGVDYEVDGPVIFFEPVETIAAGDILEYRIRVRTRDIGAVVLEARLTSYGNPVPLVENERTLIFGELPTAAPGPDP